MSTPSVILRWQDTNNIEMGHRIYRSVTPMDIQNMPSPIADIVVNTNEYIDEEVIDGNFYYYRVSAYTTNGEEYSNEVYAEAKISTVDIHDIFGDNSAVMTLQFNGDTTDLGGNYIPIENGTIAYSEGKFGQSIDFGGTLGSAGNAVNRINTTLAWDSSLIQTISVWFKFDYSITDYQYSALFGSITSGVSNGLSITPSRNIYLESSNGIYLDFENSDILDGWNHIVIITNNLTSNDPMCFLNSSSITYTQRRTGGESSGNLYIGAHFAQGTLRDNNYLLDQFRLFNRQLTQNEVNILFDERR